MTGNLLLYQELIAARDYQSRKALIASRLDEIDDGLAEFLERMFQQAEPQELRLTAGRFRAVLLSEVAVANARAQRIAPARRFAAHSLRGFQQALYLGAEIADGEQNATALVKVLLADAGGYRRLGLEEEGWQAYWIADRVAAATEAAERSEHAQPKQLLAAAVTLEQLGLRKKAAAARRSARAKIGDASRYRQALALAEKVVGSPPSELPPADVADGKSQETAYPFRSDEVGVASVMQTPCPRCHGPLKVGHKDIAGGHGKIYDKFVMECERHQSHPAVTLFKDASQAPGMDGLAELLANMERDREREKKPRQAPPPSARKIDSAVRLRAVLFALTGTLVIAGCVFMLAALVVKLLLAPESYWRVFLGSLTGVAAFFVLNVLMIPATKRFADGKSAKLWFLLFRFVVGVALGLLAAAWVGGGAAAVSLAIAAPALSILGRVLKKMTAK